MLVMRGSSPAVGRMSRYSLDGQPTNADVVVGEDNNGASAQVLGHLLEVAEQGHGLMFRAAIALTEEHEARQRQTLLGEKFAEVGVS